MNRNEVSNAIDKALEAIKEYRLQEMSKTGSILDSITNEKIEKSIGSILKEAHMLGPSGNVCPSCGGTGRA